MQSKVKILIVMVFVYAWPYDVKCQQKNEISTVQQDFKKTPVSFDPGCLEKYLKSRNLASLQLEQEVTDTVLDQKPIRYKESNELVGKRLIALPAYLMFVGSVGFGMSYLSKFFNR